MKEIKLTKKQELVLNYIKEYTAKHGFPPAVREIAKGVGLNSPSSVHSHIKRLEKNGFIKKTNSKFRTLEVVGINEFKTDETKAVKIDVYSSIPLKKQNITFDYPASRIPKNVEVIAIKLQNDINSSILKNDILIISKEKSYKKFDELLIESNNNYLIKTLINKSDITDDTKVIGRLIEVTRLY